jgi:hypothetical protein
MINIGDKVKFLNDIGGGVVTGFINKSMVNVENQDGFEIPYPVDQLINVSDPALNKKGEVHKKKPEEKEIPASTEDEEQKGQLLEGKDSPDFYFCFVPSDETNPLAGEIELFLLNDSNFDLLFHYSHFIDEKYKTVKQGSVLPNTKIKLESIVQGDLNELPGYCFQILCFREKDTALHSPVQKIFKINPVKFYKEKSFLPNAFFESHALMFQITENILDTAINKLTEDDFRKVVKTKEQKATKKEPLKQKQDENIEVDLHIHELLDNPAGLSNKEILEIQLEKVEAEMRSAIQSRAKRIVFIHGVGQGVLKQEVAKLLKIKFPRYTFQDASFKEYGYGATMVLLKRRK